MAIMTALDKTLSFQEKALNLRTYRQQLLASNIANADTPNYKAVDIDFAKTLQQAQAGRGMSVDLTKTSPMHLDGNNTAMGDVKPMYRTSVQPSIDGNTVDSNIEQAQFSENALNYMATLQFVNGQFKDMQEALRGNN
ncbi:flagellar basal-body rod protein FlgB [Novimethylophilus kurashikiensis]|uniref:Flagellar basal body rod protein FlgB n=1 Tax=Novimethylophilus kurashikiensis TaxID=1825523 RepID=A0A2R5FEP5_9PROT|nr:flagellar basal body rod protein FlgB [Novimethylophilus kurashikiensis]GBG15828.1 flagellar basal-body rod protein FlgB [Novimethylophilus kurashikiensis]